MYFFQIPSQQVLRTLVDIPEVRSRWDDGSRPAFERATRVIAAEVPAGGVVLDIGAHTGLFLNSLGNRWRKHAVEPMTWSRSKLERDGVAVHAGFMEDVSLPNVAFDCITAFDVLEHLAEPGNCIARLAAALKPGGILILETGNAHSLWARMLGPAWYYMNYIEHLQAFSPQSIRTALSKSGLEPFLLERVAHNRSSKWRFRTAIKVAAYACVSSSSGRPNLWLDLCSMLRVDATLPASDGLERDHLFVAAKKPPSGRLDAETEPSVAFGEPARTKRRVPSAPEGCDLNKFIEV